MYGGGSWSYILFILYIFCTLKVSESASDYAYSMWLYLIYTFFKTFCMVHTKLIVCVRECAFAYLCVFACLVYVWGYKGTLAPDSQPGMNGLSSIIVWGRDGAE